MRLSVEINRWDCSHMFNKWESYCYDIKVEGPNSGVSQAGTTIVDLVKVKDGWNLVGNRATVADFKKLRDFCRNPYISVLIGDATTDNTVEKSFIPTLSEAVRKPMHGNVYYADWTLNLEER